MIYLFLLMISIQIKIVFLIHFSFLVKITGFLDMIFFSCH
jgi:hypothetical protein